MGEELGRILVYGDPHLSSKNYGAHRDYPKESLDCFRSILNTALEYQVTHLIGLGDFTYGRFHTLEYRDEVERLLKDMYDAVGGRHYELKGNHDSASYGMTEYEYYIKRGWLKAAENINIGNTHLTMVDNGLFGKTAPNISLEDGQYNILFAHDFLRFRETQLPNFGSSIELDEMSQLYGLDYIFCGHIHSQLIFEGSIQKSINGITKARKAVVVYTGSLPRPSYKANAMDLVGKLGMITVYSDREPKVDLIDVELLPLEESFNLSLKAADTLKKEEKEQRVDISDIIGQLSSHRSTVGNPEDIISSLDGIDKRYKDKAIELLKASLG